MTSLNTHLEKWKDIKNYEGYYQVSSLGRVRELDRFVKHPFAGQRFIKGRIKNQNTDKDGYKKTGLSKNYKYKNASIHRLVAIAFIPNPKNKPYVNHIDLDKSNNSVENLEWVTAQENSLHAKDNGVLII